MISCKVKAGLETKAKVDIFWVAEPLVYSSKIQMRRNTFLTLHAHAPWATILNLTMIHREVHSPKMVVYRLKLLFLGATYPYWWCHTWKVTPPYFLCFFYSWKVCFVLVFWERLRPGIPFLSSQIVLFPWLTGSSITPCLSTPVGTEEASRKPFGDDMKIQRCERT